MPENEFIGFRLKQGVYGQRQPDVQMVRVKLPFGGVTPEQMDAFADVVERWAPLNKGHITTRQNIQIHHVPLRDMEELMREISASPASPRARAAATRSATSPATPGPASPPTRSSTRPPYAGAYVRYFVRHPTTQLMPRKIKTAFSGSDEDRAITGIHDIAFLSRERDGVKGFEVRVGGGTSIMARVAPTIYDFVEADNGDYLKVAEARLPHLRPPGLAAGQPRPRPDQGAGRQDRRRRLPRAGRRGARGDWVEEREFGPSWSSGCASTTTRRRARRRRRRGRASPNGDRHAFERFLAAQRAAPAPGGLLRGRGEDHPRRPDPGAVPRPRPRSCASSRGGYARSTVQQNLVLRWVRDESLYDVWSG